MVNAEINPPSTDRERRATPRQAVIFDMGNVLFDLDNALALPAFRERLTAEYKHLSDEELETALYGGSQAKGGWGMDPNTRKEWSTNFHLGKLSADVLYENLMRTNQFTREMTSDKFQELWGQRFRRNEPMIALANGLRTTTELYLLSDTNELDIRWLEQAHPDVFALFSAKYYSHKTGIMKYDHQAWQTVLDTHHLDPRSTVFIDDRQDHVDRSREIQLQGILFQAVGNQSAAQHVYTQLRAAGIAIDENNIRQYMKSKDSSIQKIIAANLKTP